MHTGDKNKQAKLTGFFKCQEERFDFAKICPCSSQKYQFFFALYHFNYNASIAKPKIKSEAINSLKKKLASPKYTLPTISDHKRADALLAAVITEAEAKR